MVISPLALVESYITIEKILYDIIKKEGKKKRNKAFLKRDGIEYDLIIFMVLQALTKFGVFKYSKGQ